MRLGVGVVALLLASLSCRDGSRVDRRAFERSPAEARTEQTGVDPADLPDPRPTAPSDTSVASCNFDLNDGKDETVFVVLGMLDEYLGRKFVEGSDHIERFYCNEKAVAGAFRHTLETLRLEQQLPAARESAVQECLIAFTGAEIAQRVNSCYRYRLTNDVRALVEGTYRPTAEASLPLEAFEAGGSHRSGPTANISAPDFGGERSRTWQEPGSATVIIVTTSSRTRATKRIWWRSS